MFSKGECGKSLAEKKKKSYFSSQFAMTNEQDTKWSGNTEFCFALQFNSENPTLPLSLHLLFLSHLVSLPAV